MFITEVNRKSPKRASGFSLIEVLIAVVILAIGLLGVAAVQVVSLQQTNNSYLQTKANLHAQNIAERIRLNGGNSLSTSEVSEVEAEVEESLGSDATVQTALNGSLATITLTWEEKVPASQESDGTETRTFVVEARVAPL
ncbi:type IV pilus assembly protein PilV [Marinobacter pelagius]|uniref:Type IV pilus assembly protein PilV n=1 Tax=Marinobacter pelagius TaxID=379482 RepID=A0A366GQJ3_9GAMM|nr:type IV pilus modification protein PilV [Marinobacter pelagius]RBP29195.1 type IV pilus assembly protein PilV [Marinobacter pelagius]